MPDSRPNSHPNPRPSETFFTPQSEHIRAVTWHPHDDSLTVVFKSSRTPYVHTGVPRDIFDSWHAWYKAGYSAGKFYHSHVKHFPLHPEHKSTP